MLFIKKINITLLVLFFISSLLYSQEFSKVIFFSEGKIQTKKSNSLPEKPKIAVILSGGGSRGMSHIGVMQVLDGVGIVPDLIVGTSIGGVVGGFICCRL